MVLKEIVKMITIKQKYFNRKLFQIISIKKVECTFYM